MDNVFYAIRTENDYVNALNIDGTLSIGRSLVRSMSSNKSYMESLYKAIIYTTDHDVCLEKITLSAEVIE